MTKKGHKSVFPTDDSRLKMLYPAAMDIIVKWTKHRQNLPDSPLLNYISFCVYTKFEIDSDNFLQKSTFKILHE